MFSAPGVKLPGAANTRYCVKAFVVLTPGQTAAEQEISAFCRARLAVYKVPKTGESRDLLPMSAVGKAWRRMLRDQETMEKKQQ